MFPSVDRLWDEFSTCSENDNLGPVDTHTTSPIHRSAPAFIQLDTTLFLKQEF